MRPSSFALRSRHVVMPGGVRDLAVVIEGERIAAVVEPSAAPAGTRDLGDAWLLPGLVDTHVHVNDPGRAEWEGFSTATAAALAGGVTTIVDMPLNSIPATTSAAGLETKRAAAANRIHCDVGLWGGVVPGNAAELEPLARGGVLGFKCFLSPSGADEFANVAERDLAVAMPILSRLGLTLLVHAELPEVLDRVLVAGDARRYATWLASRPPAAEVEAIRLMIRLCLEHHAAVHIVHLAAAEGLAPLAAARARALPITVETCPHYLCFDAESIPDGATDFKCAPPIRGALNRDQLWEALERGDIDLIASDHSPCPPKLKCAESGDFMAAWGGIASLEIGLAAIWTEARARGLTPAHVARWMSAAPARLAGLEGRKGRIAEGADADLVVWHPQSEWTVDAARLQQRHKVTPYAGRKLAGVVERVFLRGREVFADGRVLGEASGRLLTRDERA
ncbi:MAG TPA: allantoinase AllB [Candidatus Saccharimonadaceae bacterium]|nr:allantoinase AllB [Candidatus Saccharimonadaceae bacterium]